MPFKKEKEESTDSENNKESSKSAKENHEPDNKSALKKVVEFASGSDNEKKTTKKEKTESEDMPGLLEFIRKNWKSSKQPPAANPETIEETATKSPKTNESEKSTTPPAEQKSKGFFSRINDLYNSYQDLKDKQAENLNTYEQIESAARLNKEFLTLLIGSCLIATFGLLQGSTAVIIGAMLIAPLMMPILGFALGAIWGDKNLLWRSLFTLVIGSILVFLVSAIISAVLPGVEFNNEIQGRINPSLYDTLIAIASGLVGAYAFVNPRISSSISGVAIAVALMPPLCTVGIAFGQFQFRAGIGALLLYSINLAGIALSASFVFWRLRVHPAGSSEKEVSSRARRNLTLAAAMVFIISLPLGFFTWQTYQLKSFKAKTRSLLSEKLVGGDTLSLSISRFQDHFQVRAVIVVPPAMKTSVLEEIESDIKSIFKNKVNIRLVPLEIRQAVREEKKLFAPPVAEPEKEAKDESKAPASEEK